MKALKISLSILTTVAAVLNCYAASYTVTTTNDTGPNSLRAVITTANGVAGPHTITFGNTGHFGGGGTINLVSPLPSITQSVAIAGWRYVSATTNAIIVTGSPFVFEAGTSNSLQHLNIVGSVTNGQSISITGCVITNGGIHSTGVLQIISSSVMSSPTVGIWSSGDATLNGVTVSLCQGGGIRNEGTMAIANSVISSNTCPTDGGGIYSTNSLLVTACQIVGNAATNGAGGGVFNAGDLAVVDTTIQQNSSTSGGGGLASINHLSMIRCAIVMNASSGQSGSPPGAGGTGGQGGGSGAGAGGFKPVSFVSWWMSGRQEGRGQPGSFGSGGGGGGAGVDNGWAWATDAGMGGFGAGGGGVIGFMYNGNTLFSAGAQPGGEFGGSGGGRAPGTIFQDQHPGGGGGGGGFGGGILVLSGTVAVTNCTISANTARGGNGGGTDEAAGGGGAGLGGGIFVDSGSLEVVSCTIAENASIGGTGANIGQGVGGGVFLRGGACALLTTIVAANTVSATNSDVHGLFLSRGYNFIGDTGGSTGWDVVNDYQNAVPLLLSPLANNGGPTPTCALLPGSLCILGGTSDGAPPTDQRGVFRPLGQCDIGAYQYTTLITTSVTWTNPAPIVYSTPLSGVQFNASANTGGYFTYIPPAGTVLNAGSNQVLTAIFTPSDPTSYTGATNTVLITVLKTNQTINFPTIPPQTINAPPILLSATASSGLPVTYALISGDALLAGNVLSVGSTPGQVVVRAAQAGNTNYLAAVNVDQAFLVVSGSKPSITSQPTNQIVDLGGDALFSVSATTSPLTYQWQFQSLDLPGATNQSLALLRVKTFQAGPYRVIVSNPIGSVTSLVAVLTVNAPAGVPAIVTQPQSQTARVGETVAFSVGATGNATLLYQWYQGASPNTNGLVVGATGTTYTSPLLTTNTSYWVSVRNSLGLVDSATAKVTVLPAQSPKLSLQLLAGYPVITLDGKVGTNYVLQYKNSLSDANWTQLLNFNLSANPFQYFDTTATGQPRRYYRAYAY